MRDIADEVIDVCLLLLLAFILLEDEGLGSAETVVQLSYSLAVAQG